MLWVHRSGVPSFALVSTLGHRDMSKDKKPKKEKKTFKDVAYEILKENDKKGLGLHSHDITRIALKKGILVSDGNTPEMTMNSVIITDLKERGNKSRFIQRGPARFSINSNWIPKKEEIRKIGYLSTKQKGDIAEARIAELVTMYAKQPLACYRPISDDEGIDLIVKRKGHLKTVCVQVKSVWRQTGPVVASVKETSLTSQKDISIVFCMFNVDKGDLWEYVWLVPAKDFLKKTNPRSDGLRVFVAGLGRKETNTWDKYLIDRRDLGNEIINELNKK